MRKLKVVKEMSQLNIVQRQNLAKKRFKLGLKKYFVKRLSQQYWEIFEALKNCNNEDFSNVIKVFPKGYLYTSAVKFIVSRAKFMTEPDLQYLK